MGEMDTTRRRARLRFAAAVALAGAALGLLVLAPSSATPQDQIVVRGAASGSTLELSVTGRTLQVKGLMASSGGSGCRIDRHRSRASCPLRGVGSIVVRMGPSGDLVEVRDELPVPLFAYLGDGSDKFIGNAEPDVCFSQGARRNRCVGNGGDDICITGQRNSDCVGGPGDDYCKTGAGSDGCWGGPGRDICLMGPGQDGCHGEGGRDFLYGGAQPDRLYGGRGFDRCDGGPGWGKSQTCEAGPGR